jgi:DNA repair exonuclease SbcCD nuclease subunit
LFENFQLVFTGHFHRHQSQKNIVYIGSPYQLTFGEIGLEKGFVVFDTEREDWDFVKYDKAPKHIEIRLDEFNKVDVSNKFVRVIVDTKIENYVKLKRILFERGALEIVPVFEKKEELKKVKFSGSGSTKDIIREYLTTIKKDGIDNKKLLEIFEKVI